MMLLALLLMLHDPPTMLPLRIIVPIMTWARRSRLGEVGRIWMGGPQRGD